MKLRITIDEDEVKTVLAAHLSAVFGVPIAAAAPDLLAACELLINAPHQEHFATRLNDEEMAGITAIKLAIAKARGPA